MAQKKITLPEYRDDLRKRARSLIRESGHEWPNKQLAEDSKLIASALLSHLPDEPLPDDGTIRCPRCKSDQVSGLMASFWVWLKPDGTPDGEWNDWQSCTELDTERMCRTCEFKWNE